MFFILGRTLAAFSVFEECAKIFSTTYEDSIGLIFQPREKGYYIRAPREQNAFKIFSLFHRKNITLRIFLMRKWVKSCPNSVNIGTTWTKFKILSFLYPGYCSFKRKNHLTLLSLKSSQWYEFARASLMSWLVRLGMAFFRAYRPAKKHSESL